MSHPTDRISSNLKKVPRKVFCPSDQSCLSVLATASTLNGSIMRGSSLQNLSSGHSAVWIKVFLQQTFVQNSSHKVPKTAGKFPKGLLPNARFDSLCQHSYWHLGLFLLSGTTRILHQNEDKVCPSALSIPCRFPK